MKRRRSSNALRIGLLTPYSGANLGDGAIQEAVIQNVTKRCPDAEILSITLNPEDTGKRHNILSFPIAAPPRRVLRSSLPTSVATTLGERDVTESDWFSRVAIIVKKVQILHLAVKVLRSLMRAIRLPPVLSEGRHAMKAYGVLRNLDLLIASGGGQLDDYWGGAWGHPYALFKWALIAKAAGTSFMFLSVGTGSLDSKLSRFFVEAGS